MVARSGHRKENYKHSHEKRRKITNESFLLCFPLFLPYVFTFQFDISFKTIQASSHALIFLANILCVHVRKSDEMYASPKWCTQPKKKKKKRDRKKRDRTCLAFDFHRAGATHVLTVCSCQRNRLTGSPFFFFL